MTIKNSCDLQAKLQGPAPSLVSLAFAAGGSYELTGSYTTSSSSPVNWTLTLPNGKTKSGSGSGISANWDGTLSDGTLAPPGVYQATFTVFSSDDPTCTSTATLPIAVNPVPDTCGLTVSFGSTAHLASGNLAHSQELFSAKAGAYPLGLSLYYNSRDSHNASLGRGWSHSYDITLQEKNNGSVLISEPNLKYKYYTLQNGAYVGQPGSYYTLVKNVNGTFTLTSRDGQVSTFTSVGKLSSISDRNSNIINLAYDGTNLVSVTDPAGRKATFAYDGANHLTSVTDPNGNIYTFSVPDKSLASVTQPDGGLWQYSYDSNSFMLSKTDPLGYVTTYSYDDKHRVISSIDPEGRSRSIGYPQTSDAIKSTTFTEKDGGVWRYSYDTQKGYLLSKTDPQSGVTSYTYDTRGNRISTIAPDATIITATWDNAGNMLTSTDALGQINSYSYNGFGQVTTITDPQGATTTYSYDGKGNMTGIADPTGGVTTYAYDSKGNILKITDPQGAITTYTYDSANNLTSGTDPSDATTSYSYDTNGNMTSRTDPQGGVTTFIYDNSGHLSKTIDPLGNSATYTYDLSGNKQSATDENGNVTRYEYNAKNRLIATIDALNNITNYAYGGSSCPSCGSGNGEKITSLTDANGNTTRYLYDPLGRLNKETDPLGNETNYVYDAKGNLTTKTDANGNTITYRYDASGRLLKKSYPDSSEESFTYDSKGNILTAANRNIAYNFSYDAVGRMLSSTDNNGQAINYAYDIRGNKIKMTAPDGTALTYGYDNSSRLASITNGGTYTFSYNSKGQRTKLTYSNGDSASYAYDSRGNLISLIRKNAAGTIISSNSYTMDKTGNRLSNTNQERTSSYSYDNIYRLLQTITNTPGSSSNTKITKGTSNAIQQQKELFSYDPVGNRLTSERTKSYTYNQNNQLITNGGSYRYDRNGNQVQKTTTEGITSYEWDFENRLIKATTATTAAEYAYDPFGRRIGKKVTENGSSTTTSYFYDGQSIILEYDGSGAIGNKYVHGLNIDEPLSLTIDKEKYYYHADGLGSIIALTDTSGKVVQTYEYDSFGNLKDQKNRIKQPFTYTGREWDKETGLYYYRARYYDPMEGRFVQKDPIGFKGGINLYNYVQNNPINYADPDGNSPLDTIKEGSKLWEKARQCKQQVDACKEKHKDIQVCQERGEEIKSPYASAHLMNECYNKIPVCNEIPPALFDLYSGFWNTYSDIYKWMMK